jgi:selenocysteine lyase/cysteine desulfurase
VLVMRGDFPSDILPWLGLERRGVTVRQLSARGRVLESDEVEAAIGPDTRLLCLTWVHSLSGWTIDLNAIGSLCRAASPSSSTPRRRWAYDRLTCAGLSSTC